MQNVIPQLNNYGDNMLKSFEEEFLLIKSCKSNRENLKTGEKIALYGSGFVLGIALLHCEKENLTPVCICDTYKKGTHTITGLPIITPEQLLQEHSNARVLITTFRYEEQIKEHLLNIGFSQDNIFPFRFPPRITFDEFKEKHYDGYEWAYNFFADDISKKLVLDFARSHLTNEIIMQTNDTDDKYFDNGIIDISKSEVFVDGGAFTGDTAEKFIDIVGSEYSKIYCFEPETGNCAKARENLSKYNRIEIINKGLWDFQTQLEFAKDKYNPEDSSFVLNLDIFDKTIIPVCSLDEYFSGIPEDELPTFIKLDIEGAEKNALQGAVKIIKQAKPKLAICVYHKIEDIYELTRLIYNINNEYRFVLRHYDKGYHSTLLYAF